MKISDRLKAIPVSLSIHRDESAIHAHFGLLAINEEGKALSQVIKRDVAKELQDIAGEVFADLGITRGIAKDERLRRGDDLSKIVHRSVKQLHQDLPLELEAKQAEIEKTKLEHERKMSALKTTTSLSTTLDKSVKDKQAKLEALDAKLSEAQELLAVMDKELSEKQEQLKELEEKEAKNRELIAKSQQKLESSKADEAKILKRIEAYERRADDAKSEAELLGKEVERLQDMKDLISKATESAMAHQTRLIKEPQIYEHEVVVSRNALGMVSTTNVFFVLEKDFEKYKKDIEMRDVLVLHSVSSEVSKQFENQQEREDGLAVKSMQLDTREARLNARESVISERESELGIFTTKEKQRDSKAFAER